MDEALIALMDALGEPVTLALAGLLVGVIFGVAAQKSGFCLRASVVEFAHGRMGPRMAMWFLCFSTALLWTQALSLAGMVPLGETRWLAQPGSLSGAVIGGLIFGAGMVLARGCPGRLLVLSATGNLRAILSGLVFAVAAQVTLRGILAPARSDLAMLSTTEGPNPDITRLLGLPEEFALALGFVAALGALALAWRNRLSPRALIFGSGVGFAAAAGWAATATLSGLAFDPIPVESLTFSGPSADTLMFVLLPHGAVDFDVGLVPGVALGAFLAAWQGRELAWQAWDGAAPMKRALIGAALMGFGAMLAGGCSIGAGVTGAATLALTAWVALTAMWVGGALTEFLLQSETAPRAREAV